MSDVMYRYTGRKSADDEGNRERLPGIPPRDLNADDWAALNADQKKAVRDNAKAEGIAIYEATSRKERPAKPKRQQPATAPRSRLHRLPSNRLPSKPKAAAKPAKKDEDAAPAADSGTGGGDA